MKRSTTVDQESSRIAEVYSRRKGSSFSEQYSAFDRANLFRIQELETAILSILKSAEFSPLREKRILEVGCGTGAWLRQLVRWGALPENLSGIDLLVDRIEKARKLCPSGIDLQCGDASQLPHPSGCFDLVLQFTLFSSILELAIKKLVASEMLRVLRPGGLILWYDFFADNPGNPDATGISKTEIRGLFPDCPAKFKRVTLAPPLGRLVAPRSSILFSLLSGMKILNTHYLALIEKNS